MRTIQQVYVALMLQIVARNLLVASRADTEIRKEMSVLPSGYQICMLVDPTGPAFVLESRGDGTLKLATTPKAKSDLTVRYKHLVHAFKVLSFQESTARAFANDRLIADGDVGHAIRLVRCLNRMESLILPALVARRAVKRFVPIPLTEKLPLALRIYGGVALTFLGMK